MIYISSACVKSATIKEAIEQIVEAGYRNIELSGGTQAYPQMEDDLFSLKEEHELNLICHNYFPPPSQPFVLNLASLNEEIRQMSYEHLKRSLKLSERLNAPIFAYHAGFAIDIPVDRIGKELSKQNLIDRKKSLSTFLHWTAQLLAQNNNTKIYIENNVLSSANQATFAPVNPLFFTDVKTYHEINHRLPFIPLLDVAHLKVSCRSLGLDFEEELKILWAMTDYVHISDNDGMFDTNEHLSKDSELFYQLKELDFTGKTLTLEVYTGLDKVEESYEAVESLIQSNS